MRTLAAVLLLVGAQDPVVRLPDLSKIDRTIAKEPKYLANPLYGLIVFDPEGKSKVWFVLDRSSPKERDHDILYIDRNGNCDLTESGERVAGLRNEGGTIVHEPGSFRLSDSVEHTDFKLYASMVQKGVSPFLRIRVHGKDEMWGGFSKPTERSALGESPAQAPVFLASVEPPLTFSLFSSPAEFLRGGERRVAVVVGTPGSGPASFMAVHENYLVPGKDRLFGTWIGKDVEGREIRERFEIRSHC